MSNIVREYEENGYLVREYENGTIVRLLQPNETEETERLPTLEEIQDQILLNTEYLVCLAEINNL